MSKSHGSHGASVTPQLQSKPLRVAKVGNKRSKEVYSSYDEKSAVRRNLKDDIETIEKFLETKPARFRRRKENQKPKLDFPLCSCRVTDGR